MLPRSARATGFTDIGQDLKPRDAAEVTLHGYMRTRLEALGNLDLDRGLTPSGDPLFPVSRSEIAYANPRCFISRKKSAACWRDSGLSVGCSAGAAINS